MTERNHTAVERQAAGTRVNPYQLRVTSLYDDVYGGSLIAVGPTSGADLDSRGVASGASTHDASRYAAGGGDGSAAFASAEPWTYIYDEGSQRFRDVRTGQFIATETLRQLRDDFVASRQAAVEDLARQLGSGILSLDEWQAAMRAEIKMILGVEYAFGRGGMLAMESSDWTALEALVERQWGFLDGFAQDLAAGNLSPAQLLNRAGMYVNAGITAYDRGLASAHDVYDQLPEYPGETCDGFSSCRCAWLLDEQDDGSVDCYWLAENDKNTCDPCAQNARDFNPLTIESDARGGPPAFKAAPGAPVRNPWTRLLPERTADFGTPMAAIRSEPVPIDMQALTAYALERLDIADPRLSVALANFQDDPGGHWVTIDGNHIFISDSAGTRYAIGITGDQFAQAGLGDHVHSAELRESLHRLDAHHVALSMGRGGWKDDAGKLYEENALALQFNDGDAEQVSHEMAQLGRQWNQQAVLVQRYVKSGGEPQATINMGRHLSDAEVTELASSLKDQFGGWTFSVSPKTGATHLTVTSVKAWGGPAEPEFRRQVNAVTAALKDAGERPRVAWRQVENYPLDTSGAATMSTGHGQALGRDQQGGSGSEGSEVFAARGAELRGASGARGDAVPGDVRAEAQARQVQQFREHLQDALADFRYQFASTQANLPPELASAIGEYQQSSIDPNDLADAGLEEQPHITIRLGLHDGITAADVARELATLGPIECVFGDVAAFPEGPNGVPLYVEVQGSGLHDAHARLAGLPHTDTHPEYVPHATLAYLKPGSESKYVGGSSPLSGQRAVLHAIHFSPAEGDMVEIPLAPRVEPVAAGFADDEGHWITLDDGRHIFIEPGDKSGTNHVVPPVVKRTIESGDPKLEGTELGNAGWIEDGLIHGIHVTDDPKQVEAALREEEPLDTHDTGIDDLGPGLYMSATPQLWAGRSRGKWDFLDRLTPSERQKMADAVRKEIDAPYSGVAGFEKEYLSRDLDAFVKGENNWGILEAAAQPFNVRTWHPEFLKPLGIKPGTQPKEVPMAVAGKFAEVEQQPSSDDLAALRRAGYDGAYIRGGIVALPQLVVWNNSAVRQFGRYSRSGAKPSRTAKHSAAEARFLTAGCARFADEEGHWVTIDGNHILIGAPRISEQEWQAAGARKTSPGEYGRTNPEDLEQATAAFITPTGEVYTLTDPRGSHVAVGDKIMAAHGVAKAPNMTSKETFLDRFGITRVRLYGTQLGLESIGPVTDHQVEAVGRILAARNEVASEPVTVFWDRPGFYDDRFDFLQSRTVIGTTMAEIRLGLDPEKQAAADARDIAAWREHAAVAAHSLFASDDGQGGHWVTIDGNHVFINSDGQATKGPPAVVKALNQGKLKSDSKVQVEKSEHVPAHVKDELQKIPRDKGERDGDGSLKHPIQVGKDLDRALTLIAQGKHVRLDQPRQLSTMLDKVAEQVADARAKGTKAPNYDLGLVTVKGTNLFTQESQGIPRAHMPQLSGKPTPGSPAAKIVGPNGTADLAPALLESLRDMGVTVEGTFVKASDLRASQTELSGNKVAGMTQAMREGTMKNEAIFVTRDNYVVDGHHRWAAKIGTDVLDNHLGDVRMPVYKVDMDIGAMLDYSRSFARQMGIPQASVFTRLRHALADVFARFAGDGDSEGHWVTLDDGRRIYIVEGLSAEHSTSVQHALDKVPKTKGDPNADGSLGHPLYVDGDLDAAARAIADGKHVRLDQPAQVSTLVDRLGAMAEDAAAKGEQAPTYDLGLVTIPGTNLFTQESKGIPRVEMPQLQGSTVPGSRAAQQFGPKANLTGAFRQELRKQGYKITDETARAAELRATQMDLNGATVAAIMKRDAAGKLPDQRILVSRDNYVLDGHHRWAAKVANDLRDNRLGDVTMPVARVGTDIGTLLDLSRVFGKSMGIRQGRSAAAARTTFARMRRVLADLFARFAGDEEGHWITLDDGRHVFIEEDRGAGADGVQLSKERWAELVNRSVETVRTRHEQETSAMATISSHPRVSLVDLDQKIIGPQLAALTEVSQAYPAAAKSLAYVGVFNGAGEPASSSGGPNYWDGQAYAEVKSVTGSQVAMGFNPSYFGRSYASTLGEPNIPAEMQHNVETGWFPPEATNPGYTAVHEFGHVVAADMQANHPSQYLDWLHGTDPTLQLHGGGHDDTPISGYAAAGAPGASSPANERLAESFAAYYFGSHHWQANATANALQAAYHEAPTYAHPRNSVANHSATFDDDEGGHWVTLDDGRHIFIAEGGSSSGRAHSSEVVAATRQKRQQAAQLEKRITPLLKDAAAAEHARLEDLAYRLKTQESLARKIADRADRKGISAEQSASGIADALRYTMVAEPEHLAAAAEHTINRLEGEGLQVSVDNFWGANDAYNGLNGEVTDPHTGQKFELQFHTPESYATSRGQHADYEIYRDVRRPLEERRAAFARMVDNANRMKVPPNVERIGHARFKGFTP